jgi:hypothetical protein
MPGFAVKTSQRLAINYTLGIILAALALNLTPKAGQNIKDLFATNNSCTKESTTGASGPK